MLPYYFRRLGSGAVLTYVCAVTLGCGGDGDLTTPEPPGRAGAAGRRGDYSRGRLCRRNAGAWGAVPDLFSRGLERRPGAVCPRACAGGPGARAPQRPGWWPEPCGDGQRTRLRVRHHQLPAQRSARSRGCRRHGGAGGHGAAPLSARSGADGISRRVGGRHGRGTRRGAAPGRLRRCPLGVWSRGKPSGAAGLFRRLPGGLRLPVSRCDSRNRHRRSSQM